MSAFTSPASGSAEGADEHVRAVLDLVHLRQIERIREAVA